MSYPRIVNAVFTSPWAIQRSWFSTIFSLLHSRIYSEDAHVELPPQSKQSVPDLAAAADGHAGRTFAITRYGEDDRGALVNFSAYVHTRALAAYSASGNAADYYRVKAEEESNLPDRQIMHIFGSGVIGKHISSFEEMCAGGLSIDKIQAALKAGRDDEKVAAILLHLDTPGGLSTGNMETAALVRQIAEQKIVGAFCDSLTASAGYWSVCPADAIYITPSADMGSIGVYSAIVDYTAWCEKKGIRVELIKDGTYKGMGYPGTTLTDEQRQLVLDNVMECSGQFKNDVRNAREGIADATMQGQCFGGQSAIDAKLADTLVNDLDEALADIARAI